MKDQPDQPDRPLPLNEVLAKLHYGPPDQKMQEQLQRTEDDAKLAFIFNHDAPFSDEERAILKQGK